MEITIKSLKVADFASDDSLCFTCKVYADGVLACVATNDGNGGCDNHYVEDRAAFDALCAHIDALPKEEVTMGDDTTWMMQPSLDTVIGDLVSDELQRRERQKIARRGVAWVINDDDENFFYWKFPAGLSPDDKERCRDAWWPKIKTKYPDAQLILKDGTIARTAA